jgi:beta-N-acetylhexosaminidase
LNRAKLVDIGQLRKIVGDTSHLAVARTVAQRSITLAKDSLNQVPLTASPVSRILLVTIARRTDLGAGSTFNDEFQRRGYRSTVLDFVPAEDMAASFTRVLRDADSAQVVIISSYVGQSWDAVSPNAPQALSDFISTLVKRGKRPIVVAFGNPYFLQQVPSVPAYLVAWGGFNVSQTAAAKAILGEEPITGKLPITIPISPRDSVRFGTGIVRMH